MQFRQKVTRNNEGGIYFCIVNDGNSTEIIDSAQVLIGCKYIVNILSYMLHIHVLYKNIDCSFLNRMVLVWLLIANNCTAKRQAWCSGTVVQFDLFEGRHSATSVTSRRRWPYKRTSSVTLGFTTLKNPHCLRVSSIRSRFAALNKSPYEWNILERAGNPKQTILLHICVVYIHLPYVIAIDISAK